MKFKIFILLFCIPFLNMMCCGSNYTPITYKYLPTGDVVFQNKLDKYITLKDTIKGPFDIYFQFETEKLYAYNFSIFPMAFACKVDFSDTYLNRMNIYKHDVRIDNQFIYKDAEASKIR